MLYLFVALFLFFDAVVIHILVCRQSRQEGQLLLKIFFLIAGFNLVLCWAVYLLVFAKYASASFNVWTVPLPWASTAIYLLLIPTYLVFYFSTQQMSPSKKIMILLLGNGMSAKDLQAHFKDEELIVPRITDLLTTGCIVDRNGRYTLTFSGVQMARVYALYQAVLGRKKGG
jgi:hypothetical protein